MKIIYLFFLLSISLSIFAKEDDEFYRLKMINNLNLASTWLIENGVNTYSDGGKEAIWRKLVDDWGVQLWVDPWIESDRYINGFWIKARGIHHNVLDLHREKVSNSIYEFWVVKIHGKDWTGVKNNTVFYVTKTNTENGIREILLKSESFIENYKVNEAHTITFPKEDVHILYELSAWDFPESYKGSGLVQKRVIMDRSGNYQIVQ